MGGTQANWLYFSEASRRKHLLKHPGAYFLRHREAMHHLPTPQRTSWTQLKNTSSYIQRYLRPSSHRLGSHSYSDLQMLHLWIRRDHWICVSNFLQACRIGVTRHSLFPEIIPFSSFVFLKRTEGPNPIQLSSNNVVKLQLRSNGTNIPLP